jgi:2-oxoglutarate ferredoxin oxidoreductase subunit gamma
MSEVEIQIGGFGGQGVILAGMTIGRGLSLHDNYHVSLTQSFGPEARGSACSVQLVVSREPVLYPYLKNPDILVVLSQEAYRLFVPKMKPDGLLIIEEDLVLPDQLPAGVRLFRVPATRLAEDLKRKMVMNMVVVGFFTAVADLLSPEAARRAVIESVPRGTDALNLAAFEKGYTHGLAQHAPMAAKIENTSNLISSP